MSNQRTTDQEVCLTIANSCLRQCYLSLLRTKRELESAHSYACGAINRANECGLTEMDVYKFTRDRLFNFIRDVNNELAVVGADIPEEERKQYEDMV